MKNLDKNEIIAICEEVNQKEKELRIFFDDISKKFNGLDSHNAAISVEMSNAIGAIVDTRKLIENIEIIVPS